MSATVDYDKALYDEIRLKNELAVDGINFEPDIFKDLELGTKYAETVQALFAMEREFHAEYIFPSCIVTPKGKYLLPILWNRNSLYKLTYEDGRYLIRRGHKVVLENVLFLRRPAYYGKKTSDGTEMRTVAQDVGHGNIYVAYSNECALKDKGLDCLFCNINATKAVYAEKNHINWKTADQIAETVKEAYKEGFDKVTISGGFIPERREVDYYIDVAEAIMDATGLEDFNGTACVGAPLDFSVFEKYKEAGYSTIATNMEIWNEGIFNVICPGKKEYCGGRQNWLNALEEEVNVFGRHKVRSTFVAGIEPKQSLLEGFEYLTEKGVIVLPSQWFVNAGSGLEGCRTPEPDWHWDVFEKTVALWRKEGITWDELRGATAEPFTVAHDLFRLYEGVTVGI